MDYTIALVTAREHHVVVAQDEFLPDIPCLVCRRVFGDNEFRTSERAECFEESAYFIGLIGAGKTVEIILFS
jgi:hypothetical protein